MHSPLRYRLRSRTTRRRSHDEKKVTATPRHDADETMNSKKAPLGDLSSEDEKVLIDALRKQDEYGTTVQKVFEELS